MRPVPSFPLRPVVPAILTVMAVLSTTACDSDRMLSGVFQSDAPVFVEGAAGFEGGRWMELMLAQFGPDVTGIVSVFDEDQFIVPASGMCACRYIESGTTDEGEFSFAFRSNGDCPGSAGTPLLIGSFIYVDPDPVVGQDSDDYLTGTLVIEGGDRTTAQTMTFHRVRVWNEVTEEDLLCGDPLVHGVESGLGLAKAADVR